jgi:hypothetical protein
MSREFGFRIIENLHTPVEHFYIPVLFTLYNFGTFCSHYFCCVQFWNLLFLFFLLCTVFEPFVLILFALYSVFNILDLGNLPKLYIRVQTFVFTVVRC